MYPENEKEEDEMELPGFGIFCPSVPCGAGSGCCDLQLGNLHQHPVSLAVGILLIVLTQLKRIKNIKASIKSGSTSGLNSMLTVGAVMGLSRVLGASPVFQNLQVSCAESEYADCNLGNAFFGTTGC